MYGSIINRIEENPPSTPEVGGGATLYSYTDRLAGTVISLGPLLVQEDHATRTDKNGMSEIQEYTYRPDPEGQRWRFRKDRRGRWREAKVSPSGRHVFVKGGLKAVFGRREKYHDFSF